MVRWHDTTPHGGCAVHRCNSGSDAAGNPVDQKTFTIIVRRCTWSSFRPPVDTWLSGVAAKVAPRNVITSTQVQTEQNKP